MQDTIEIWKDVTGYEGFYQISNKGRVKSLSRIKKNGSNSFQKIDESIMKPGLSSGYLAVSLYKNNIGASIKVHQLVAIAFLNHTPCGFKNVINHKDFNRLNNDISNIEIVTIRQNNSWKKKRYSSQFTGVYKCGVTKKWVSCITIENKSFHLGYSETELQASNRYQMILSNIEFFITANQERIKSINFKALGEEIKINGK